MTLGCLNVTLMLLDADAPVFGANVTFTVARNDFFLASDRLAAVVRLTRSVYVADLVVDRVTLLIVDPATVIRPAAGTLTFSVADVPVTAVSFETLTDAGTGFGADALPGPWKVTEPAAGGSPGGAGT